MHLLQKYWGDRVARQAAHRLRQHLAIGRHVLGHITDMLAQIQAVPGGTAVSAVACGEQRLHTVDGRPIGLQPLLRKMRGISHLCSIPCATRRTAVAHFALPQRFICCAMRFVFTPPVQASVPVVGQTEHFPVHRIYCVGRNYAEHAKEMGFTGREAPFFFMKPADAVLTAPDNAVAMPYPALTSDLHHEIELVVAIGKGGHNISAAQAMEHVWGYAVGLDMTRRDLQGEMKKQGRPWCIGKGFDHSAPISAITPAAQAGDIEQAEIWLQVNGQDRQRSQISQLIWNIAETIEHLSSAWTLQPGDLIMTGTPQGVGAVRAGDVLQGGITGLGTLRVDITA